MKSFFISIAFFILILTGIVSYQVILEKKADEINSITLEIQQSAELSDKDRYAEATEKLSKNFEEVKNWLMAFEDHEQILEMAQCIQELKGYKERIDESVVMIGLNKFRYLLNYSVESVKPTLENIL